MVAVAQKKSVTNIHAPEIMEDRDSGVVSVSVDLRVRKP